MNWRQTLRRRFLNARIVMLRHPWAPGMLSTRTTVPVGVYAIYEGLLATFGEGGFNYHLAHRALHSFGSMLLGFVQEVFTPAAAGGDAHETGGAELARMAEMLPHVTAMMASEIRDKDVMRWVGAIARTSSSSPSTCCWTASHVRPAEGRASNQRNPL